MRRVGVGGPASNCQSDGFLDARAPCSHREFAGRDRLSDAERRGLFALRPGKVPHQPGRIRAKPGDAKTKNQIIPVPGSRPGLEGGGTYASERLASPEDTQTLLTGVQASITPCGHCFVSGWIFF
jgi:hypothetical protein